MRIRRRRVRRPEGPPDLRIRRRRVRRPEGPPDLRIRRRRVRRPEGPPDLRIRRRRVRRPEGPPDLRIRRRRVRRPEGPPDLRIRRRRVRRPEGPPDLRIRRRRVRRPEGPPDCDRVATLVGETFPDILLVSGGRVKIHEYQGKQVFAKYGVPVPKGYPAFTVDDAEAAAKRLASETGTSVVVVKAQIHAGGRGKGGGVKVAKGGAAEARQLASIILGMQLVTHQTGPGGQKVRRLYIEQ